MIARSRGVAVAASLAVVLFAAAACSSSGGSDGATDGATSDAASAGEYPEGTTLKLWHYEAEDGATGKAWAEAMRIFEETHPGVKIEFEKKAFDQIQNTAGMVLSSDEGPDIMEYNKGNATAGLLASQGLLTNLTDVAKERGWDTKLPGSLLTTAIYDERGVMGSGDWYGVPNYGECMLVYYNKDMFDEAGLQVPTTLAEFEDVMQAFVDKGVTPLTLGGAEFPLGQVWYELALGAADRQWVNDFQLYENPVDFHGTEATTGAQTLDKWVKAGYISSDAAALKNEDMALDFTSQKAPIMITGSWLYGRMVSQIADSFNWGIFRFPGKTLTAGSSGQLWVVPENSRQKDLAYDFIDITMSPEVQAVLGNAGGLPVAADPAQITDPKAKEVIEVFNDVLADDGLSYYPDWPVPGFGDVLTAALQSIINQTETPEQALDQLVGPYEEGVANIVG